MLNNVIPQRGTFFGLLSAHTDRLVAGANASLRLITGLGNPHHDAHALIEEVNQNETSGDEIKADLIRLLYQSFTTPLNRDQIHTLTLDLDRVLDGVQSVANSIEVYRIEVSTPPAREMASLAADACIRLSRAVVALGTPQRNTEIRRHCADIESIEANGVEVMRRAVTQLFEKEGDEAAAWHAMKMRGFYFMQEAVLDSCKRAGRTLEEIVLENA